MDNLNLSTNNTFFAVRCLIPGITFFITCSNDMMTGRRIWTMSTTTVTALPKISRTACFDSKHQKRNHYIVFYIENKYTVVLKEKNLLFTSCNWSFFFKSFNFILKTQNIKKNQNLSLVHCKKVWTKIHKITFLAINSSPSWFTSVIAYATHFVAAFTSCFARFNTIWTKVTIIAFWKRYTHVM